MQLILHRTTRSGNRRSYLLSIFRGKNFIHNAIIGRDVLKTIRVKIDFKGNLISSDYKKEIASLQLQLTGANISTSLGKSQVTEVTGLLNRSERVFAKSEWDIGRTDVRKHSIPTGKSLPTVARCYRIPLSLEKHVDSESENMLKAGIIRPNKSPWRAPITLPKKKDGSHRFCTDFRILNEKILRDQYPLPEIQQIFDKIAGRRFFTSLDLQKAY
ncbi:Retrovirus-related Pol polyprotein [Thelohanellus kitauei]|uniref:Retrovirus-related Pol polyprotein n=1 Tax=Thelohanellus kitauei TaxID=669202 RepID=A0A0C2MBS5_THEKT|nr:Retrovirus-related Pol polyprotein [Thelohanellus kitauei]